jgi:hypothetical protein
MSPYLSKKPIPRMALILGASFLASCSFVPQTPQTLPATVSSEIEAFSANRPENGRPRAWQDWIITRAKAPTEYRLVRDPLSQRVVLHARADRAASGLKQRIDADPAVQPVIAWQWRIPQLIEGADNTDRHAEDSPARLLLFFDGDISRLPAREQAKMETARLLTGQDMPYATLMYIWENRQPVGTVIPSMHTTRVKMVVVGNGTDRLGQWKQFERNYNADFQRAFGEAPGRLIGVGILSDTDNTGAVSEAFYGDIELRPALSTALR